MGKLIDIEGLKAYDNILKKRLSAMQDQLGMYYFEEKDTTVPAECTGLNCSLGGYDSARRCYKIKGDFELAVPHQSSYKVYLKFDQAPYDDYTITLNGRSYPITQEMYLEAHNTSSLCFNISETMWIQKIMILEEPNDLINVSQLNNDKEYVNVTVNGEIAILNI